MSLQPKIIVRLGAQRPGALNRVLIPFERQRGVAMAIVVWFIAGMSLLVAGTVLHARVDTRMAQLHVAKAKAAAAGDGAIALMLAQHLLPADPASERYGAMKSSFRLGQTEVMVTLVPAAGFINLGTASQEVLAALFMLAGQLPGDEANFLADNVVKWREGRLDPEDKIAHANEFQAIEDLLRVDGVSRTLLDNVRDYIVAGSLAGSSTNWAVAPEALLQILEMANPEELERVSSERGKLAGGVQEEVQSLSGTYRADALVAYGDQVWLRRRWVTIGSMPGSQLPWHVARSEPPRIYEQSDGIR